MELPVLERAVCSQFIRCAMDAAPTSMQPVVRVELHAVPRAITVSEINAFGRRNACNFPVSGRREFLIGCCRHFCGVSDDMTSSSMPLLAFNALVSRLLLPFVY
jgi:hypothetical protein